MEPAHVVPGLSGASKSEMRVAVLFCVGVRVRLVEGGSAP